MRPVLGTYVEVAAHAGPAAEAAIEAAFASLHDSHARWSFHQPDSELSQLNRQPGVELALSRRSLRVLRLARAMTVASGGLFNCTVGGELVRRGLLPEHGPGPAIEVGVADDLQLTHTTARLRRPVRITLDGIAKGYAVDLAVRAMRQAGVRSGWVNAGGDLRVFGDAELPLHRREAHGGLTPLGRVRAAALASSQTGLASALFPGCIIGAAAGEAQVFSVMAQSAWRADALTKVAAAAAPEERAARIARLGGHWVGGGAAAMQAA